MDCAEDLECIFFKPKSRFVEAKQGVWYGHNKKKHGDTCFYCSVCEKMAMTDGYVWELTNYCPYCGAKMDGERSEHGTEEL